MGQFGPVCARTGRSITCSWTCLESLIPIDNTGPAYSRPWPPVTFRRRSAWPYEMNATLDRIGSAKRALKKDKKLIELKRKWNSR